MVFPCYGQFTCTLTGGGGGGGALSHITLGQFNKSRCGMVLYIIMTSNIVKILTQHIFCINLITKMYLL